MLLVVNNSNSDNKTSQARKLLSFLRKNKISHIVATHANVGYLKDIKGIILTGSPIRLSDKNHIDEYSLNLRALITYPDVPVLGICFGCQLLYKIHGGKLKDIGNYKCEQIPVELEDTHVLFKDLKTREPFFCFSNLILGMKANDLVKPIGYVNFEGKRYPCAFQFANNKYGLLFHPESRKDTQVVIKNFVENIM